jgi:uncharacterized membrane protein YgdD (TMEM256/DUF423 family)
MDKRTTIIAIVLIASSIVLGAFGAHALKKVLTPEELSSFEVGVRYQMYHGLALLMFGLNSQKMPSGYARILNLILAGVVLFSVSIYLLSVDRLIGMEWKWLGPVTPLGGVLLIAAWVLFAVQVVRNQTGNQ